MLKGDKKNEKVFIGLSGGVDSAVAAALLKEQGYDVAGVFMRFWKDGQAGQNACCSVESEAKALGVAKKLGIPFYIFNFEAKFKKAVVDYFLKDLKAGRTPNPCVVCNPQIKFGLFLAQALKLGADFVSTGHYALTKKDRGTIKLFAARDKQKDQSYFLHRLGQRQLKKVIFPLGGYTKEEVYELAKRWSLPHQLHQSFDICFAADYPGFLKKHLKLKPGKIIDAQGKEIGRHGGLPLYTIGQRASVGGPGPFFVLKKDVKKNLLSVSNIKRDLFKKEMLVEKASWVNGAVPRLARDYRIKIRYGGRAAKAVLRLRAGQKLFVVFDKPQWAITPGQSAVFYGRKGEVLGGGIIK